MHPSDTTFSDVLQGVVAYKETNSSSLTQEQLNSLTEIQHTLERLDNQFNRLMGLNTRLVAADNISHTFDPSSGTMTIRVGELTQSFKLRPADPNVPNVSIMPVQSASQTVYHAGGIVPPHQTNNKPLRLQMEELLVSYYYGAHRVLKLVKTPTSAA